MIVEGAHTCLCVTDAGGIETEATSVCGDEVVSIPVEQAPTLDDNDQIRYVLHDGRPGTLGNILASNPQAIFQFLPGMQLGYTYYVTPVAGNGDENGFINLDEGCLSLGRSVPITFYAQPTATINALGPTTLSCTNPILILTAASSMIQGPASYQWETNDGSIISATDEITAEVNAAGQYALIVTTDQGGCTDTTTINIQASLDFPRINIALPDTIDCNRTTVEINASASNQGTDYLYSWQGPSILTASDLAIVEVDQGGIYTLSLTKISSNCTSTQTLEDTAEPIAHRVRVRGAGP